MPDTLPPALPAATSAGEIGKASAATVRPSGLVVTPSGSSPTSPPRRRWSWT